MGRKNKCILPFFGRCDTFLVPVRQEKKQSKVFSALDALLPVLRKGLFNQLHHENEQEEKRGLVYDKYWKWWERCQNVFLHVVSIQASVRRWREKEKKQPANKHSAKIACHCNNTKIFTCIAKTPLTSFTT